jgi:hypothetical protein
MTEPASITAMRQLVAEARLRRLAVVRRSGARRPAVQQPADDREHGTEEQLADADELLAGAEPGHRGDQEDDGDAEQEQSDQPLAAGVAGSPGLR